MFHRVSLVEPLPNSTKLKVNPQGLAALRQLTGPVAPVVVIGPYRSGKSFLINQMLQQSCGTLPNPSSGHQYVLGTPARLSLRPVFVKPLCNSDVYTLGGKAECLRCLA